VLGAEHLWSEFYVNAVDITHKFLSQCTKHKALSAINSLPFSLAKPDKFRIGSTDKLTHYIDWLWIYGALHLKSLLVFPNYKYFATLWLHIRSYNAINKGAEHHDNCRKIIKYSKRCSAPKSTMQGF